MVTVRGFRFPRYLLVLPLALALGVGIALLTPRPAPKTALAPALPKPAPTEVVQPEIEPAVFPSRPKPVVDALVDKPAAATPAPAFVETEDGIYEAATPRYRATLSAEDGLSYTPLSESAKDPARQLRVAVNRVSRGDTMVFDREDALLDTDGEIAVNGDAGDVAFWRAPGFEERYIPRGDGIEQTFLIEKRIAGEGDLDFVCDLALQNLTPLPPRAHRNGGIVFVDSAGKFAARYGQVVVRDSSARGMSIEPKLSADGKSITFSVPSEWLQEARYPVEIDPLVGADFLVSPDNGVGVAPPIVIAGNNGFLVVWNDYRAGGNAPQVFAAIVSQSGISSTDFPISSAVGIPQDFRNQRIQGAFDGSNWLVAWSDDRQVGPGIRCSIISTLGQILGGNDFLIAPTTGTVNEDPLVSFNGIDFVVAWQDIPPGAAGGSQIYYTRVTSAGVVDTPAVVPAETSPVSQTLQFMASQKPSGDTLLIYRDNTETPSETRSVRIPVDGTIRDPLGTALFKEDTSDGGFGRPIGLAYVDTAWHVLSSPDQTVDSSIYLHKVDPFGVVTPPTGVFATMGLGPTGLSLDQYAPAFAGTGEWLFIRNEKINSTVYHLIGKRVTFAGVDQDPVPFQIDTSTQGILRNAVAAQSGNVFLAGWLDGRRSVTQPADAKNIIAALVDATIAGDSGTALVATIAASPLSGEAPLAVSFDATASSTGYDTITWDFGDGTTSTVPAVSHTYQINGTYIAQLKLTKGAYEVYDTAVIIVGGGGTPGGGSATQVGIPVEGSAGMQVRLFIASASIRLDFSTTGNDAAHITGILDDATIPTTLTGLLGSVSIGNLNTAFNLDAKGHFKTDKIRFNFEPNKGTFAFDIVKTDLRSAMDALGATNATTTKALQINVPITVSIDKFSATATVGTVYRSTLDIGGNAGFAFLGTGTEVSGSFLIGKFSASEQTQKATGYKVHTFSIKGQVKKPNGGIFKRAPAGQFIITVGNFSVPIPVGQFQGISGRLKYVARAGVYGLKKFNLDLNSGEFNLQMLKVPAEGAGGDGLPLARSGGNVVKVDLNLSFQFDLDGEKFSAGRFIHIQRKDANARNWKMQ
jgi:PKD repeat protein